MQLYLSPEHACSYLSEQESQSLVLDPGAKKTPELYSALIDHGFRRSGDMIYRPECSNCSACTPMRIPVESFQPRRNQRRIWKKSFSDIQVVQKQAVFNQKQFNLFHRYIQTRHPEGEMSDTSEEGYIRFLGSHWAETRFFEFHLRDRLLAVAVTDLLTHGLSAVYTFFEPEFSHLSPGVFTILWQIEECKRRNLPFLYLGYWIPGCKKMAYKSGYWPQQRLTDGEWIEIQADDNH